MNKLTLSKEMRALQSKRRSMQKEEEEKHNNDILKLWEKYNITPPASATLDELTIMIGYVLDTGNGGTIAIREYAMGAEKTDKWKKEIAKKNAGKLFNIALNRYEDNETILSMKANRIYDARDIINNTVTGALTKLSKQLEISKVIDNLKDRIVLLEKNLSNKEEGIDWKIEAQRLRDSGRSLNQIAIIVGKAKATVGRYTH